MHLPWVLASFWSKAELFPSPESSEKCCLLSKTPLGHTRTGVQANTQFSFLPTQATIRTLLLGEAFALLADFPCSSNHLVGAARSL